MADVSPNPFAIRDSRRGRGSPIPKFIVDLSVSPGQRYNHIVPHLQDQITDSNLTGLFDELVNAVAGSTLARALQLLARTALRRLYLPEETAELKGISSATRIPLHLLVAFNVLLDLLLGCTSGGVRVEALSSMQASEGSSSTASSHGGPPPPAPSWLSRMLHFRTLDWGMEPLRNVVIELDYVQRAGEPVVATSVTYFGYIGVLTGVRRGLSMSLNFRPRHDCSTRTKELGFRLQQMLVVLGFRQSISSVLRRYLLMPEDQLILRGRSSSSVGSGGGVGGVWRKVRKASSTSDCAAAASTSTSTSELDANIMRGILEELSSSPSTSCYLIFCTPQRVYSVEKDHHAASIRESDTFLTTYNHDASDEIDPTQLAEAAKDVGGAAGGQVTGMDSLVAYSCDRKRHLDKVLRKRLEKRRRRLDRPNAAIGTDDLLVMVKDPWISNEESHYAVIMDPTSGQVLWRRLYEVQD
jgi:hypothetical protein